MDFAIEEPGVKIAIEVDGFDKAGNGGMTPKQFANFLDRQNALMTQGWVVLRFTNSLVTNDPVACRRQIELALQVGRAVHDARAIVGASPTDLEELERLRAQSNDLRVLNELVATYEARQRRDRLIRNALVALMAIVVLGAGFYVDARRDAVLGVEPDAAGQCPDDAPIKGNRAYDDGEAIYHVPGGEFYGATTAVRCFPDEQAAVAAGFRRSLR